MTDTPGTAAHRHAPKTLASGEPLELSLPVPPEAAAREEDIHDSAFWMEGVLRISEPMRIGKHEWRLVLYRGTFRGQQISVTQSNGDVMMDLVLDIGIGERGLIKVPFYGTTGTLTIPRSLQSQSGGRGVDRAGPLQSGETISGRIGDFNGDGHIDGTIVAVGVMPLDSPVFPGQPYALSRNFETDIAHRGDGDGIAALGA